jgi:tRNA U34 5-methylaminomethyl-2-thiouridine-forming methyltransferase MnmC
MTVTPEILPTDDGSHTLRHPAGGETYHSARGAIGEAEHVFVRAGFDALDAPHVRVFEMGFGSGLNALLTLRRARQVGKTVDYHTVERFPVAPQVAARLNFSDDRLEAMHAAPWDEPVCIDRHFRLIKYNRSLPEIPFDTLFAGTLFELIYFDAFSPDSQPELWTAEIFQRLYARTAPGGILTTYSAKGEVRRALQAAGFAVEKLPGALGKRHMLRGRKLS